MQTQNQTKVWLFAGNTSSDPQKYTNFAVATDKFFSSLPIPEDQLDKLDTILAQYIKSIFDMFQSQSISYSDIVEEHGILWQYFSKANNKRQLLNSPYAKSQLDYIRREVIETLKILLEESKSKKESTASKLDSDDMTIPDVTEMLSKSRRELGHALKTISRLCSLLKKMLRIVTHTESQKEIIRDTLGQINNILNCNISQDDFSDLEKEVFNGVQEELIKLYGKISSQTDRQFKSDIVGRIYEKPLIATLQPLRNIYFNSPSDNLCISPSKE